MVFTCLTILANTSIVTLEHYNIQAIVKRVLVFTSIYLKTAKIQSPELNQVYLNMQVNKLTLNQLRICQIKANKNKLKEEVDASVYIMHWGLHTNQISA